MIFKNQIVFFVSVLATYIIFLLLQRLLPNISRGKTLIQSTPSYSQSKQLSRTNFLKGYQKFIFYCAKVEETNFTFVKKA